MGEPGHCRQARRVPASMVQSAGVVAGTQREEMTKRPCARASCSGSFIGDKLPSSGHQSRCFSPTAIVRARTGTAKLIAVPRPLDSTRRSAFAFSRNDCTINALILPDGGHV